VWYNNGNNLKWVVPRHQSEQLRELLPAKAPPLQPYGAFGNLVNDQIGDMPREVYVEVYGGFIQWWLSRDAARAGTNSEGNAQISNVWAVFDYANKRFVIRPSKSSSLLFCGEQLAYLKFQFAEPEADNSPLMKLWARALQAQFHQRIK